MRDRAVSIIHRNAGRLGRLIEDLLLAASVRAGRLRFDPKPIDLAGLTRRSVQEVESLLPNHPFELHTPSSAYLLADEDLLTHAEWSLLSYAAALSPSHMPIGVSVDCLPGRVRLEVTLADGRLTESEISRAFSPFAFVQYEENGGLRQTGLYLCREVAQVHGGSLRIGQSPEGKSAVTLELPA
jgi:signal transduction histidine kinase